MRHWRSHFPKISCRRSPARRIRLDGADLAEWDLAALRASIGYVEQDAPLLSGTLRDNLVYGRPEVTDEESVRPARTISSWPVIPCTPSSPPLGCSRTEVPFSRLPDSVPARRRRTRPRPVRPRSTPRSTRPCCSTRQGPHRCCGTSPRRARQPGARTPRQRARPWLRAGP
ncbi:hypothetical protein GTY80_03240 [Amycolatopsis sp. SID8362]|nr:hypothetical protein [Amycolatopsis sp. SID8362]